jgi:riboflavin biosynthesis pyrimidine reductase
VRLKSAPGDGLLWVGGNMLAVAFLEEGLIDELRVILTPILIGGGTAVFRGIRQRSPLRLLSTSNFASGVVVLTYAPDGR